MLSRHASRIVGIGLVLAAGLSTRADAQTADAIYYNGIIVTMNDAQPAAQAVAVAGVKVLAVGTTADMKKYQGANTRMVDLSGQTLLPGFIDAHSHMAGYGILNEPKYWVDVAGINVYFKPLPGSPDCPDPTDYQRCFIPVRSQDDVMDRLKTGLAHVKQNGLDALLAANYDPARLGPTKTCAAAGFECPSFENGKARETLDKLSLDTPIYIESESGHISYVNSKALKALNICGTDYAVEGCYKPTINADVEAKLANLGQLDEDLTFYGTGYFQGQIFAKQPQLALSTLRAAAKTYAAHGFTLTQEGATNKALVEIYKVATREPDFPTTAGLVMWEATKPFKDTLDLAVKTREEIRDNPRLFVAAVKSFSDGSPLGFTAYMAAPYLLQLPPFTDQRIFQRQPYLGLPDVGQTDLTDRVIASHTQGFPMIIHQNGVPAIEQSLAALTVAQQKVKTPSLRDVVLHAPEITKAQLTQAKTLGNVTVSFLVDNIYFWGQPLCQQIWGSARALGVYPTASAVVAGLNLTIHHDSPVTPPDPLFGMWIATTRRPQQTPWYPPGASKGCPDVFRGDQSITILRGLQSYTTDAAWQYGLENTIGRIIPGYRADFAILSANPLDFNLDPDGLLKIKVMATVSQGRHFQHIASSTPPASRPSEQR